MSDTADTLSGWPVPEGLAPYRPPAPVRSRRGLKLAAVLAAVFAAGLLAVVLLWHYIVATTVVFVAYRILTRRKGE